MLVWGHEEVESDGGWVWKGFSKGWDDGVECTQRNDFPTCLKPAYWWFLHSTQHKKSSITAVCVCSGLSCSYFCMLIMQLFVS